MPRSRKRGSINPLPYTPSWCSAYIVKYRDNFTFLSVGYEHKGVTFNDITVKLVEENLSIEPKSWVKIRHRIVQTGQ
jgi:hypothetical protein